MFEVRPDANWAKLERYLREFPKIAGRELRTAMSQSVATLEREIKPNVPVGVSGELRSSIGSQVTQDGPTAIVGRVGSSISEAYPVVMEAGARAHMPPLDDLVLWVRRKRLSGRYSRKSGRRLGSRGGQFWEDVATAFLIAQGIASKGIAGRFFMKKGWEASRDKVNGYFAAALERIANRIGKGGAG